jgi:putative ABC transport system substrate-binding protein
LGGKRVNLISELVPNAATIALLVNPNMAETDTHIQSARMGADALGCRLLVLNATTPAQLEPSFDSIVRGGAGALVVQNDPFFDSQRDRLIALSAQHSLPAIYHIREYPAASGLMSYGASLLDAYKQVGANDWPRSQKVSIRRKCPCCSRRDSNSSSTVRPRVRSTSQFHLKCSLSPMR